jgi:beta-RFAP synthase
MQEPTANAGNDVEAVEVRTPARLHLGMFSFGRSDVRSFGGVGMMIERPGVQLRVMRAASVKARGVLAERAVAAADACLRHWRLPSTNGVFIDVISAPREHAGLGCGTQLSLAVAAGIGAIHGPGVAGGFHGDAEQSVSLEPSQVLELARAVGRGKRSCIGLHGFARGGLIIESGRLVAEGSKEADGDDPFSPLVARVRLPSTWRCVVVMQKGMSGLHGEKERRAFEELPAVPLEVTAEMTRIALLDLMPAANEGNFSRFADAVSRYGAAAGRPFEAVTGRLESSEIIRDVCSLLGELGARGVTQSSWGPTVFACCESLAEAAGLLERIDALELSDHLDVMITKFDSEGASIRRIV